MTAGRSPARRTKRAATTSSLRRTPRCGPRSSKPASGSTPPGYGLAFTIPPREDYPEDPCVLVDYDDARDPETGAIHPVVREHIQQAESYADVSTSGTGVHIFCRGSLPDGVKAIDAPLPGAEGFEDAEIEVYDAGRYSGMTGAHIVGTPRETRECQSFLEDLADEYATVAEGTPDGVMREPEKTEAELADVETTTDIQDVFDAIQHTRPGDIRLRSHLAESDGASLAFADADIGADTMHAVDGRDYDHHVSAASVPNHIDPEADLPIELP